MEKEMGDRLIPELHDLLKIVGSGTRHECPHSYKTDLNKIVGTGLWKTLKHHCVTREESHRNEGYNCQTYPIDRELFCIHIADGLASRISRRLEGIYKSRKVFRAWQNKKEEWKEKSVPPNSTLLKEINETKEFTSLFGKYEREFRNRPEDVGKCPFASLYTHSILTKYWYEFLMKHADYFEIPEKFNNMEVTEKARATLNSKPIYLVYAKIKSETLLVRLKDTYLLETLEKKLSDVIRAVGGTLIYDLQEEVLFILPKLYEENRLIEWIKTQLTTNHFIEMTIKETTLERKPKESDPFLTTLSLLFGESEKVVYPKLDNEICVNSSNEASRKAIICDLCQKDKATKIFEREKTPEYLCDSCYRLREEAPGRPELAKWKKRICLVEISLDIEELLKILSAEFNRQFGLSDIEPKDFGFSVVYEFLEDYKEFLNQLKYGNGMKGRDEIKGIFNIWPFFNRENREEILNNLFFLQINELQQIMKVVEAYESLYREFFPNFLNQKRSPIYLTISSSNVHHPFFEHWRLLDELKRRKKRSSIFVNVVGKGKLEAEIWRAQELVLLFWEISAKRNLRKLHKLAEIAKYSEELAEKILIDEKDGDPKKKDAYTQLLNARPWGLSYESLLTLAKIGGEKR